MIHTQNITKFKIFANKNLFRTSTASNSSLNNLSWFYCLSKQDCYGCCIFVIQVCIIFRYSKRTDSVLCFPHKTSCFFYCILKKILARSLHYCLGEISRYTWYLISFRIFFYYTLHINYNFNLDITEYLQTVFDFHKSIS